MALWKFAAAGCLLLVFTAVPRAEAQTTRHTLNAIVPELNFNGVALEDAIEFIRDVSNANLHVNWRALEEVGIERDTPIMVRLRRVPLGKVLSLVLTDAAGGSDLITYYLHDDIIRITTRELADRDMVTRVYPVEDLLMEIPDFVAPQFDLDQDQGQSSGRGGGGGGGGGGASLFRDTDRDQDRGTTKTERAQQLIDLITSIVQPDIWAVNGGRAAIRYFNGSLIVTAPRSVHESIGY
jgi:hypothetical protein